MQRQTTFLVGGGMTIALGVALALGLLISGAGVDYLNAWLAAGLAVALGAFFVHVARDEGRYRRAHLEDLESEGRPPPSGPGG